MCRGYKKVSGNVGRQQLNQHLPKRTCTGCLEIKKNSNISKISNLIKDMEISLLIEKQISNERNFIHYIHQQIVLMVKHHIRSPNCQIFDFLMRALHDKLKTISPLEDKIVLVLPCKCCCNHFILITMWLGYIVDLRHFLNNTDGKLKYTLSLLAEIMPFTTALAW